MGCLGLYWDRSHIHVYRKGTSEEPDLVLLVGSLDIRDGNREEGREVTFHLWSLLEFLGGDGLRGGRGSLSRVKILRLLYRL